MGLLFIVALLAVGYVLYKNGQMPEALKVDNRKAPIDIINERYARGEIDREEYRRMKSELR